MTEASCCSGRCPGWRADGEGAVVTQQGPEDVDAAAGEGDDGGYVSVATKTRQPSCDLPPDGGSHLLGALAQEPAQVCVQAGLDRAVQNQEGRLVTVLGPCNCRAQGQIIGRRAAHALSFARSIRPPLAEQRPGAYDTPHRPPK